MSTAKPATAADAVLTAITDYALDYQPGSAARTAAHRCLMDSLACAMAALGHSGCTRLLGPLVPDTEMQGGTPVPGTYYRLDPTTAALNIGAMIRWLDYNDTWLAAEWGHPSDNLGAILASADYIARAQRASGSRVLRMSGVLDAIVKAYEIQGVLALTNSFNAVGLDHVILVRVASAAVATVLLGGWHEQVLNAVSNAFVDGGALRVYRHAPDTGSRKSWAAGDATARGVFLAQMAMRGEMGYPHALSAPRWGFEAVFMRGKPLTLAQPLASHVVENILFKIRYPAEFHAQTAAEAAIALHAEVKSRLDHIERIELRTTEPAMRIICKDGPLHNPADRDHCLQYIVAVALARGRLEASDYADGPASADPMLEKLRGKMVVKESRTYTRNYYDPALRAIGNSVQVFFKDGSHTRKVAVEYPLGHPRRRHEAIPALREKFLTHVAPRYPAERMRILMALFSDPVALEGVPVDQFMDFLQPT